MNAVLPKVSAFITREGVSGRELLVFDHDNPGGGTQIPAGTVEPDEPLVTAILRETHEESGLIAVRIVQTLDSFVIATEGWHALIQPTPFRQGPAYDAPVLDIGLGRGTRLESGSILVVRRVQGEWAEVDYELHNPDSIPPYQVMNTTGWVPASLLASHLSRTLFHLVSLEPTPETWDYVADGHHLFHFHWVPLVPRPRLSLWQDPWLELAYEQLLAYKLLV